MSPDRSGRALRPNVLVLMSDQHAAHLLSCAGASHVHTPALDALAAKGTRFTRAYTTFPLCVPARASMMTGRHPHRLRLYGNKSDGPEPGRTQASLGHLLRESGYDTAYAGKWHALQPSGSPEDGSEVIAPFGDRGLAAAAGDWLGRRRGQKRPFALVVSFDDPHSICESGRHQPMPYGDIDDGLSSRDLPPLPDNHNRAAYEPEALRHEQRRAGRTYGTAGYGPDDWRRDRHVYARLVERVDSYLGEVLAALDGGGLADSTVVASTSDHGDASHAGNQKTALFEETCRVPLIIRDPRMATQVAVTSVLVNVGLDLLPTLRSVAQRRPYSPGPGTEDGLNLIGLLEGRAGHRAVVVETSFEDRSGAGTMGRSVISDRYKYTVYGWGAHREQLFDLLADPGERRNLAVEFTFDSVLERKRAELLDRCRRGVAAVTAQRRASVRAERI